MEFWSIVLGVIVALLLLAWRYDRRHRDHVASNIDHRAHLLRSQAQSQAAMHPPQSSTGGLGGGGG